MVWPGEPGMLEPGLEHTLSDDERVGYGVNKGLDSDIDPTKQV